MAIPPTAQRIASALDPNEELDFRIQLGALLEEGEVAASYQLNLLPEAVALGLTLMEGDGRDHVLIDGRTICFWATIDEAFKTNAAFDAGIALPLDVLIVTSAVPPRTRNRTILLQVSQQ